MRPARLTTGKSSVSCELSSRNWRSARRCVALELHPPDWGEHWRILGAPAGLLSGADPSAFHILIARLADEDIATAMAFDHDGDSGLFNVSTLEAARRRREMRLPHT